MGTSPRRRVVAVALLAATLSLAFGVDADAQSGLQPGEAFLTRFSGTAEVEGVTVIDANGVVGSIVDTRISGDPPVGGRIEAPQRLAVTAGEVGQVFGIAIGGGVPPRVYLSATSAFGLHRSPDNLGWMPGMWGADGGGPSTIYVLDSDNDFEPEILADVVLDGRANTGAGLGNMAYDRWSDQLFVSDLETGMIHRLRADDGFDLGQYDHGVTARQNFYDVAADAPQSLPPVAFDPASAARISDCPSGDFSRTPSCWNFADFRRRVWGLAVRHDPEDETTRLYYSVWGSQGFGSPDYAAAGDDQRNSIWSVGITASGDFDTSDIRREFFLPDFFRAPEAIARAGLSNPVTDIAFSTAGRQTVMLLAERGGIRNLGLAADDAFAYPHEARVLRYEVDEDGDWQPGGRFDVGHYDRKDDGPPYVRANASGGVAFGPAYPEEGTFDPGDPDTQVWMTGDGLCAPEGPCFDASAGSRSDSSFVDGLQGSAADAFQDVEPEAAFQPYPAPGPAYPAAGPDGSYMIDADAPPDPAETDATEIGDVALYQASSTEIAEALLDEGSGYYGGDGEGGLPPDFEPPYDPGWDPAPLPPDDDWWDPPPIFLETDLAVAKDGPATCQEGVDCHYTLTIKNVGAIPYIGLLALTDTMPAGATLSTASPGWNCIVSGADVSCVTLGFAILPVGGTATLHLDVQLPVPIADPTVENCVAIDWFEMGTDDGPGDGNDFDCIDTPVADGFDLGIEKDGPLPPQCIEGANCFFLMKVTNYGPGGFSGTLAIHDVLPPGVTFVAGPDCVGLAGTIDCQRGGVTLGVGASEFFIVLVKLPTGIAGTSIENCADIDWSHMGADDGAPDVHADHDCATVDVLPLAGYFDLTVTKAGPAHCDAGGECKYELVVTNNGPDDYAGGIALHDTMPAGATFVSFTSASPWICLGAPPDVNCAIVGALLVHPGDSFAISLTIKLPDPIPGGATVVTNCADLPWGSGGLPADDNPAPPFDAQDSGCIDTNVDEGFDLQVSKLGPAECYEGGLCDYSISVTNGGPRPFNGLFSVKDALPAGAVVETSSGVWSCSEFAPGTMTCGIQVLPLAPATTATYHLGVRLPDPVVGDTVENCATMDWSDPFPLGGASYTGDDNPANDGPACVTTPVLAANLAPFGGTVCEKGAICTLDVSIDNRGGRLFKGAAGLRGTLIPAVRIDSVESLTEGLSCNVTGEGTYACGADELTLKPGDSAKLQVMIDIPADFAERRIVHQKEMVWPDAGVRDAKPEDDRHVSTIMIAQPEEPAEPICKGGEFVNGECKCPEGLIAKPSGEGNFDCVKPPLVCTDGIVRGGECFCPEGAERRQVGGNAYQCEALPSELTCEGGRVRRGDCVCPEGTERRQVGENAYECVAPPPPEIICDGGRVRRGDCVCPEGTERRRVRENVYECVAPQLPEIICDGGRVRRGQCVCPEGLERRRVRENVYECVAPPPPEIICDGGRVRRGQCVCPEGTERRRVGENAYQCEAPAPPEIICEGGRVRRGQCVCPEGAERRRVGENAYECVEAAPPEIICDGGRVRRGQCVCPEASERQQVGENAYQCIAAQPSEPEITCEGGRVRRGDCVCPRNTVREQTGFNGYVCVPQASQEDDVPRLNEPLRVVPKLRLLQPD